MNKVETYSNWCNIDKLDGTELLSGDVLRVRWPDESETEETVIVVDASYTESDMGTPCRIPVMKAFVQGKYRGVPSKVSLVGLECEFVRMAERPPLAVSGKRITKK